LPKTKRLERRKENNTERTPQGVLFNCFMWNIRKRFRRGPGAFVNFLTFKKGIDFFQKMSIIIIVRGKERNRNNAWTQKHLSLDLASISEKI